MHNSGVINTLNEIERSELAEHEATIERGIGTFIEVGTALLAIRDGRLYRAEYDTFEDYCRERWGISKGYANQLTRATKVINNLEDTSSILPDGVWQAKPLMPLEPDQQREAWQRAVETAPNGKITAGHVQRVVDDMTKDDEPEPESVAVAWSPPPTPSPEHKDNNHLAVHYSSATPEHYTPSEIIAATLECLGEIDLDPCSNSQDDPNVPAAMHYTKDDDGLSLAWHGRVYMNPPYGRVIEQWVEKIVDEFDQGHISEAIALVPARTDTQWWQVLREFPVCFVVGRLKFGDLEESAPFPSAVFYLGHNLDRFYYAFQELGDVWQLVQPWMFGSE